MISSTRRGSSVVYKLYHGRHKHGISLLPLPARALLGQRCYAFAPFLRFGDTNITKASNAGDVEKISTEKLSPDYISGLSASVTEDTNGFITVGKFVVEMNKILDQLDRRPKTLGLAVSGGVDSMALVYLASQACTNRYFKPPIKFHAFIVNHGIRNGSRDEALWVADKIGDMSGISAHVYDVGEPLDRSTSTAFETRARSARYRTLARACLEHKVEHLVLAHHGNDQAETVLLRLLSSKRAIATRGLAGMRPLAPIPECHDIWNASSIQLMRPLLTIPKAHLRTTLVENGISWVEDDTNRNVNLTKRNTVRYLQQENTLPQVFQPRMISVFATNMRRQAEYTDELAEDLLKQLQIEEDFRFGTMKVTFPTIAFVEAHHEVATRTLAKLMLRITSLHKLDATSMSRVHENITQYLTDTFKDGVQLEPTRFTEGSVLFTPVNKNTWLLSRQKYSVRVQHGMNNADDYIITKATQDAEHSPWLLWDNRFWLRAPRLEQESMRTGEEILHYSIRTFDPACDLEEFLKHSYMDPNIKIKDFCPCNPSDARSTIPVIIGHSQLGEQCLLGIPTLDKWIPGVQKWGWTSKMGMRKFSPPRKTDYVQSVISETCTANEEVSDFIPPDATIFRSSWDLRKKPRPVVIEHDIPESVSKEKEDPWKEQELPKYGLFAGTKKWQPLQAVKKLFGWPTTESQQPEHVQEYHFPTSLDKTNDVATYNRLSDAYNHGNTLRFVPTPTSNLIANCTDEDLPDNRVNHNLAIPRSKLPRLYERVMEGKSHAKITTETDTSSLGGDNSTFSAWGLQEVQNSRTLTSGNKHSPQTRQSLHKAKLEERQALREKNKKLDKNAQRAKFRVIDAIAKIKKHAYATLIDQHPPGNDEDMKAKFATIQKVMVTESKTLRNTIDRHIRANPEKRIELFKEQEKRIKALAKWAKADVLDAVPEVRRELAVLTGWGGTKRNSLVRTVVPQSDVSDVTTVVADKPSTTVVVKDRDTLSGGEQTIHWSSEVTADGASRGDDRRLLARTVVSQTVVPDVTTAVADKPSSTVVTENREVLGGEEMGSWGAAITGNSTSRNDDRRSLVRTVVSQTGLSDVTMVVGEKSLLSAGMENREVLGGEKMKHWSTAGTGDSASRKDGQAKVKQDRSQKELPNWQQKIRKKKLKQRRRGG